MAKIILDFDTVTKELEVTIDGVDVEDVINAEFYQSYDDKEEFNCGITTSKKDETNDMRMYTRLVAAETKAGQNLVLTNKACASVKHVGFVEAKIPSPVEEDFANFFSGNKKSKK